MTIKKGMNEFSANSFIWDNKIRQRLNVEKGKVKRSNFVSIRKVPKEALLIYSHNRICKMAVRLFRHKSVIICLIEGALLSND